MEKCCEIPTLMVDGITTDECEQDCNGNNGTCCTLVCLLKKMNVLRFSTDPNLPPEIESAGLIESFLLSVKDSDLWRPVVTSSTNRCYNDNIGNFHGYYYCKIIPNSLFSVIGCCYKENYLKCPTWNPGNDDRCDATRQFVEECAYA